MRSLTATKHPNEPKFLPDKHIEEHADVLLAQYAQQSGDRSREPLPFLRHPLGRNARGLSLWHPHAQWTMNSTLATIGIHFPKLRKRALAIGEKLGVYRDFPVSKGCTSPFAPIWINEMVKRQG